MKFVKKSDLKFDSGYLVHKGKIVAVDPAIVKQCNAFDLMVQKAEWTEANRIEAKAAEPFERKSMYEKPMHFKAETPIADKKVEDTMAWLKEKEDVEAACHGNKVVDIFEEFVRFVVNDKVMLTGGDVERFDCPVLGDPLAVTEEQVAELIANHAGTIMEEITMKEILRADAETLR